MFCSHCGSRLLEGSNQCLHCGRIESSVRVATPDRPTMATGKRRRRGAWVLGVLLVLANAGLAFGVARQAFVPMETPGASGPQLPAEPVTPGIVPPMSSSPSERWTLSVEDLAPVDQSPPTLHYPGLYQPDLAVLAVAVSASDDGSYVRGIDLSSGGVAWQRRLEGKVACGFNRLDAMECFSSDLQISTVRLSDGEVTATRSGRVESPQQVWVADDGALVVMSVANPGGDKVHDVDVTLTRVSDSGATVWTQTATLPVRGSNSPVLHGVGPVVAATSTTGNGAGGATPTILRTLSAGAKVGELADGLDATLLDDGRIAVRSGPNASTVYDASGKELFPVSASLVLLRGRDVPSADLPTLGVVTPKKDESNPEAPTLVSITDAGAAVALGQGNPDLVCGGVLVTHDEVSKEHRMLTQMLDGGSQAWETPLSGDLLSTACDGTRLLALTSEGPNLVLRAYALTTGDPVWKEVLEKREYVSDAPGHGWFLRDTEHGTLVMVGV